MSLEEPKPWAPPKTAGLVSKMASKTLADCRTNYEMAPREHYEQRSHDIRVKIDYVTPREYVHPIHGEKTSTPFKAHSGFVKNTPITFEQWEYYYGSDREDSDE